MKIKRNNYAYIDGNNLYRGVNNAGWRIDFFRFRCLVKFLKEKNKIRVVLSPSIEKMCSILLKRINVPITYLTDVKNKIELKRKSPH